MDNRLDLQQELETILGSRNVYFQPPSSLRMKYPCIRYHKSGNSVRHANNMPYVVTNRYEGIVIDHDPESEIADKILASFPMCSLGNSYVSDNLNHFPFTLYY